MKKILVAACFAALSSAAWAQDSVALTPCLPGDAINPYDANEQCDSYVVDMDSFTTSWGTTFGIAPIVKSPKASTTFINNLISAQGMSRKQAVGVPFASNSYALWTNAPGVGVNNNPAINAPAGTINTANRTGNQFGVTFASFGTTNPGGKNYNDVTVGLVNIDPVDTSRLYVKRVLAAINGCDSSSDVSQFGLGAVDELGNVAIRADNNALGGPSAACSAGNPNIVGNNYFVVDASARTCGTLNVLSNNGGSDVAATNWILQRSTVTHNPANIMPKSIHGPRALVLGSNFNKQYVRGDANPPTSDTTQLGGAFDHRGTVCYIPNNFSCLNSTAGTCAIIGKAAADPAPAERFIVWGVNAAGTVTGNLNVLLPGLVTDSRTGAQSASTGGLLQSMCHYFSQTAFRGGNSMIAIGADRNGKLLAAAPINHGIPGPTLPGSAALATWSTQYIGVARYDCATGQTQWSMAGYCNALDGNGGVTGGKPILDGPGGNVIGRMSTLNNVTGAPLNGASGGPSISAPMIDSVGNVWFISSVELNDGQGGTFFTNAVLRAVLVDEANLGYELELVFRNGSTFDGINSGRQYRVSFLSIADSNSVDTATAWSGNISGAAHMSGSVAGIANSDPRTLGGLVIYADITYDYDQDGSFQSCTATTNPGPADPRYAALLYVGALTQQAPPCPGDINHDGQRNLTDLSILLAAFGTNVGGPGYNAAADLNNDGTVNLTDLATLLGVFGSPCP